MHRVRVLQEIVCVLDESGASESVFGVGVGQKSVCGVRVRRDSVCGVGEGQERVCGVRVRPERLCVG